MMKFLLNDTIIETGKASGTILLDFIRKNQALTGTKIGCREGDCGACTVLVGELNGDEIQYKTVTSCLTPLGNVAGKHVVTIEGLNGDDLTPVQRELVENNGTQCGFCTPGIVVSMTGHALSNHTHDLPHAKKALAGNICRCTGYKSIEKSADKVMQQLVNKPIKKGTQWLVANHFVPAYFLCAPEKLKKIADSTVKQPKTGTIVSGGTDLYVQRGDQMEDTRVRLFSRNTDQKNITIDKGICTIGAGTTITEWLDNKQLQALFPALGKYGQLISSTQIRNMATIAGNFVNASPIGDLSIIFLALKASVTLKNNQGKQRKVALKDFFKSYKNIDLRKTEFIENISFNIPPKGSQFFFEKVSKRTHLDIAGINTAISLRIQDELIEDIYISAGGVSPVPLVLTATCDFLKGKKRTVKNINAAMDIIQHEISPISDIRGSAAYKSELLQRIIHWTILNS